MRQWGSQRRYHCFHISSLLIGKKPVTLYRWGAHRADDIANNCGKNGELARNRRCVGTTAATSCIDSDGESYIIIVVESTTNTESKINNERTTTACDDHDSHRTNRCFLRSNTLTRVIKNAVVVYTRTD